MERRLLHSNGLRTPWCWLQLSVAGVSLGVALLRSGRPIESWCNMIRMLILHRIVAKHKMWMHVFVECVFAFSAGLIERWGHCKGKVRWVSRFPSLRKWSSFLKPYGRKDLPLYRRLSTGQSDDRPAASFKAVLRQEVLVPWTCVIECNLYFDSGQMREWAKKLIGKQLRFLTFQTSHETAFCNVDVPATSRLFGKDAFCSFGRVRESWTLFRNDAWSFHPWLTLSLWRGFTTEHSLKCRWLVAPHMRWHVRNNQPKPANWWCFNKPRNHFNNQTVTTELCCKKFCIFFANKAQQRSVICSSWVALDPMNITQLGLSKPKLGA